MCLRTQRERAPGSGLCAVCTCVCVYTHIYMKSCTWELYKKQPTGQAPTFSPLGIYRLAAALRSRSTRPRSLEGRDGKQRRNVTLPLCLPAADAQTMEMCGMPLCLRHKKSEAKTRLFILFALLVLSFFQFREDLKSKEKLERKKKRQRAVAGFPLT